MIAQVEKPLRGWNSFDCYGIFANKRVLIENLEAFSEILACNANNVWGMQAGPAHMTNWAFLDRSVASNRSGTVGTLRSTPAICTLIAPDRALCSCGTGATESHRRGSA